MIKYFETQLQTISNALHSMNDAAFSKLLDQSCDTIQANNKIIVSGLGKNVPICEKFVGSMVSLGMNACFMHTNSAVHGDLGVVKDGDLVILLTKSGKTVESVYLTELLMQRQVKLWLLTFSHNSILTEKIDNRIILDLEHEGDQWNIMPNNSTTINLMVLQGLAMKLAERQHIDINVLKSNHPGGYIGKLLQKEDAL
jgi:arabinose-5-phosphate isomerase